jgi:2-polyprenyl-3-methyl-5-hydroxy-6-metoxy-1,4-benzoquinol methylase
VSAGRCVICGAESTVAFVTADRNRRLSTARFTYQRCEGCGTLSLAPVPVDLSRYYPPEYYVLPRSRAELLASAGPERYKLDIVGRFVPAGRLVEIGPAVGGFAVVAQEAGYETSAIEMDAACCEFLRTEVGIAVHETADPTAALAAHGPFEVIAMWHVIEHLENPREALAAAAAALQPGGVLALAAPNPDALQFRVLRSRWTHIDAPRHLVLVPISTLEALALELGLDVVLATTSDPGTLGWNLFGWRESLAGFARGRYPREVLRRLGSAVGRAIAPLERRGHNGATFTLVLRRPSATLPNQAAASPAHAPRTGRPIHARRRAAR